MKVIQIKRNTPLYLYIYILCFVFQTGAVNLVEVEEIKKKKTLLWPFCMVFTRVAVYRDPVKFEYDSSGVLCMWLGWSTGVRGGGLEGYVFCCDNLHYGFPFFFFLLIQSVWIYYRFKCFWRVFFLFCFLMSLNRGMMCKSMSIA